MDGRELFIINKLHRLHIFHNDIFVKGDDFHWYMNDILAPMIHVTEKWGDAVELLLDMEKSDLLLTIRDTIKKNHKTILNVQNRWLLRVRWGVRTLDYSFTDQGWIRAYRFNIERDYCPSFKEALEASTCPIPKVTR